MSVFFVRVILLIKGSFSAKLSSWHYHEFGITCPAVPTMNIFCIYIIYTHTHQAFNKQIFSDWHDLQTIFVKKKPRFVYELRGWPLFFLSHLSNIIMDFLFQKVLRCRSLWRPWRARPSPLRWRPVIPLKMSRPKSRYEIFYVLCIKSK